MENVDFESAIRNGDYSNDSSGRSQAVSFLMTEVDTSHRCLPTQSYVARTALAKTRYIRRFWRSRVRSPAALT